MLTRPPLHGACLSLLMCLGTGYAEAQMGWIAVLKDTPAERFDDEDLRLFIEASRKALADTPEGGKVSWQNPATQSRGDLTVVSVFTWRSNPCRRIQVVNESEGRRSDQKVSLCRIEGRWRAVTESQLREPPR
jgi:surface antigen